MLRSLLLTLLISSSLLACSKGPKVTVYISNPDKGGMDFHNNKTKKDGFVTYWDTDKFVCLEKTDMNTLLVYCNEKKRSPGGSGPVVTAYISNPQALGMDFYNRRTGEQGFVAYSLTDKFVCLDPDDTLTLLQYCGVHTSLK